MHWFPLFLNLFALGTAGALAAVPAREIGRYFFKFHSTTVLVVVSVAALLGRPWEGLGSGTGVQRAAAAAAFLFAVVVLVQNVVVRASAGDVEFRMILLPALAGAAFAALAGCADRSPGEGLLLAVHLLTAAAVLGTALVAMTTGHWYLANAQLPIGILVRLTGMHVLAVGLKAAVTATYGILRFETYSGLEDFYKLVIGVRIGAGLILAMVLALMSLSCAKRKATQSATGILYVSVVFVLIGETISLYLTLGTGRPI